MEYHSTVKRNTALIHVTTRMNTENMMLSESSQMQKTTYSIFLLYAMSRNGKSTEIERFMVAYV